MTKLTTTDCYAFTVDKLQQAKREGWTNASTTWTGYASKVTLSWIMNPGESRPLIAYHWGTEWPAGKHTSLVFYYDSVPTAIGGTRCFLVCPHCARRVNALYCPKGNALQEKQAYLFCRHCWRLTYESRQKRRNALERIFEFWEELRSPNLSDKRWMEIERKLEPLLPALDLESEKVDQILEQFMAPAQPRSRGRPSPKKQRAEARAAKRAERAARPQRPPGRPKEKQSYVRKQPFKISERTSEMQAYCPKCRDRRELKNGKPVRFSNGRPAMQGTCSTCGTKTARIVKAASTGNSS